MGKSAKKIIKKSQIKKPTAAMMRQAKEKMQKFIDLEEYDEALTYMADLVKEKIYDAELVYQAAYSYYMICDYERAAQWLENALILDADNTNARLLLARLCILEDRLDDGLDIYEFVVEHYANYLTAEQQEDMYDVLDFYNQHESEKIEERHALNRFMKAKE